MKIKLKQAMAGTRFSWQPRHIIQCSDETGKRLITAGVGVEADKNSEIDGELPDPTAEEKAAAEKKVAARKKLDAANATLRRPETAAKGIPGAAVTSGAPPSCTGTTGQGNPCKKAPVDGTDRCANHARES